MQRKGKKMHRKIKKMQEKLKKSSTMREIRDRHTRNRKRKVRGKVAPKAREPGPGVLGHWASIKYITYIKDKTGDLPPKSGHPASRLRRHPIST